MKNYTLYFVFFLTLLLGWAYFFYEPSSHSNSKYGFKFNYDDSTSLESKGNIATCGSKYNCATFTGAPNFGYSSRYNESPNFLAAVGTDYEYDLKDGEIYKTFFDTPDKSVLAVPYMTNKNGVKFFYAESSTTPNYCTFQNIEIKNEIKVICFHENNSTFTDETAPTGSLLYALETFKFQ